ncbi:helix-turn-helix domain-containing protein [Roseovarius sp. TE539]|uniref:helix-turn-helix domain-containing protein n=1 Tax=Roseovarius sp. TE539 TaxID=2249812 RepID=UPI0011BFA5CE
MKENFAYPSVYDVKEVAQILSVKTGVIYREIRAGRLAARKVGKQYRVHSQALDRYLLEPWEELDADQSQRGSGYDQTMGVGSSSTVVSKSRQGPVNLHSKLTHRDHLKMTHLGGSKAHRRAPPI